MGLAAAVLLLAASAAVGRELGVPPLRLDGNEVGSLGSGMLVDDEPVNTLTLLLPLLRLKPVSPRPHVQTSSKRWAESACTLQVPGKCRGRRRACTASASGETWSTASGTRRSARASCGIRLPPGTPSCGWEAMTRAPRAGGRGYRVTLFHDLRPYGAVSC
nr:uncharacterized protein LOC113822478 [Penaeus vannamei]